MPRLSELQLARRSGATRERIRRLVEIGALRPDADGRFDQRAIRVVQVVAGYERGGVELDDIALALREGRVTFDFADRLYPAASLPSRRTVGELAEALGASGERLPELLLALGLPVPSRDRSLSQDDERILTEFVGAWGLAGGPEVALRAARLLGDPLRRAVEGWVDLFLEAVDLPPEKRAQLQVDALVPRMFEPGVHVARALEPTAVWLLRRHLERALDAVNVEAMERALEDIGRRPRAAPNPPAVVFADLSGFTRITEEEGDQAAARHASALASLASAIAAAHDGRVVKQLGDGVMLAFARVDRAVDAALALRASVGGADLPPLHIGVSAGPLIERDGDYFGRTVNLASRISGVAGPGEILADATTADAARDVEVTALGERPLRGLTAPVSLFRIDRPPDPGA